MSPDAKRTQERADAYRQQDEEGMQEKTGKPAEAAPSGHPRRTPEQWSDFISQRIEEAMRAGAFDNLPGRGKPLNAAPEPHVAADMQMANSLLKNNNLTPAWIGERAAVLAAIERFRRALRAEVERYQAALAAADDEQQRARVDRDWQQQLERWRAEVRTLNRKIELQNFSQPADFLEIFKLQLERELAQATG